MMYSNKSIPLVVILITSAVFTLLLCHPLIHGELFFVDDHELVKFTTSFNEHTGSWFSFLFSELMQTEVGQFLQILRFRPALYILNITGATILGYNPGYWFALNAVMLYAGLVFFGLTLKKYFSLPVVILSIAILCAFPFHMDLWPRLGPSERYAFLFVMLFMYALARSNENFWAWIMCCLSFMLALGVKENFICLLLPLALAGWIRIRDKQATFATIIAFVLVLAFCIPFVIVLLSVLSQGSDIYQGTRSTGGLFSILSKYFIQLHFFVFILCASLLYLLCKNHTKLSLSLSTLKHSYYCLGVLFVLSLANFVFYNGTIAHKTRYAFPFHFFSFLAFLCVLYTTQPLLARYAHARKSIIYAILALTIGTLIIFTQIRTIPAIKTFIKNTQTFKELIDMSLCYDKAYVINVNGAINAYEPYVAMGHFAKAGLSIPFSYFPIFGENKDPLSQSVEKTLRKMISKDPVATIDASTILLTFNGGISRKIEHGFSKIPASALLANPYINSGIIRRSTTIFFPVDNPSDAKEIILRGSFDNFEVWQCNLNKINVTPDIQSGVLVIPISEKAKESMPTHDQLFELELLCLTDKGCSDKRLYLDEAEVVQK